MRNEKQKKSDILKCKEDRIFRYPSAITKDITFESNEYTFERERDGARRVIKIKLERRRGNCRTVEHRVESCRRVTRNRVTGCRGKTEGVLVATTCRQMGVVSAITMGVVLSRRVAAATRLFVRCT